MQVASVSEIINETKNIKTILFNLPLKARPGQFVMVWIPGVDEIPMSISYFGDEAGITVLDVGEATHALHGLKPGDKIGIKGPLGNGFKLAGKHILAIGGGSGMAALAPAAEKALKDGRKVTCAIGARTSGELLFEERLRKAGAGVHVATDDGSKGNHGFVTEVAEKLISEVDQIMACGPEPMLKTVVELARKNRIKCQVSLERYMKCGIGLCGSCQCGKYTICGDGPVFSASEIAGLEDFGRFKRDSCGRKVKL